MQGNIMLSKLERQSLELFKQIRNLHIPINLQIYLFYHVILHGCCYGALNKAKLLEFYIMIFSDRLLV